MRWIQNCKSSKPAKCRMRLGILSITVALLPSCLLENLSRGGASSFTQNKLTEELPSAEKPSKTVSAVKTVKTTVSGAFDASSETTQTLNGSADLEEVVLSIPAGSLAIDTNISMETASDFGQTFLQEDLGLGETEIVQSTPAVTIKDEKNSDGLQGPMTLSLPIPGNASLNLTSTDETIIVLFQQIRNGQVYKGAISSQNLDFAEGTLSIQTKYFGTYQAIRTSAPVKNTIEKKPGGEITTFDATNYKLADATCSDPALDQVLADSSFMLCDGSVAQGTLVLCTEDGQTDCVAKSSFKAINPTGLAARVKNGVTVAGVVGTYPSSTNPLAGASSTKDLDGSSFATKIKSAASFEYFDSAGTRYTGQGDADIAAASIANGTDIFGVTGSLVIVPDPDPWNVRHGIVVGGTSGKLKLNCRNMADVSEFDNTGSLAIVGLDIYDTVDDFNGGISSGGADSPPIPIENPWVGDEFFCGFNNPVHATWERVTTTPATSTGNSVYKDIITGMMWTRGSDDVVQKKWDDVGGGSADTGALEYCEGLSHGGSADWRLPTQKELMGSYLHGIHDLDDGHTDPDNLAELDATFWSSTSKVGTSSAWRVHLGTGETTISVKAGNGNVLCVSP